VLLNDLELNFSLIPLFLIFRLITNLLDMKIKLLFFFSIVDFKYYKCSNLMDYRSVGTGKWNSLSSWQYYDANNVWRTPTITQGYPGFLEQEVTIRDSHSYFRCKFSQ
jgi:hypothetical protein